MATEAPSASFQEYLKKANALRAKLHKKQLEKIMTDSIRESVKKDYTTPKPPSQPPDPRPQPARKLKPLPINYQPLREMDKVNFGENRQSYITPDALSLKKPLAPNVLDVAAMEREKELAAQRRKAGHKWVMVIPR